MHGQQNIKTCIEFVISSVILEYGATSVGNQIPLYWGNVLSSSSLCEWNALPHCWENLKIYNKLGLKTNE